MWSFVEEVIGTYDVTNEMLSDKSWSLISSWWEEFRGVSLVNDELPRNGLSERTMLPTRLIDVGDFSSLRKPHLVLCHRNGTSLPYLTLSHRWPSGAYVQSLTKLTRNSLEAWREELPLSALHITFQEAIGITRNLGVRYLWIDALCILQDDSEDWSSESSKMGQIYKNAICNIAVGGDFHPTTGIFRARDPAHVRPLKVDIKWNAGVMVGLSQEQERSEGPYYVFKSRFMEDHILNEPINMRAWVLQERLLSPRVLYFGTHQIFWKDSRGFRCETFPNGIPGSYQSDRPESDEFDPVSRYMGRYELEDRSHSHPDIYKDWNRLITLYSRCDLTRPSDKLIALSGLAQKFESVLDGARYHAGLWENTLPRSLLWQTKKGRKANGTPTCRFDSPNLPSWSWLSVNGEIEPDDLHEAGGRILVSALATSSDSSSVADSLRPGYCPRISLRGRLFCMKYARWNEWLGDLVSRSHSSQVAARIGVGNFLEAVCSIDDPKLFMARWDDRTLRAVIRSKFFVMILDTVFVVIACRKNLLSMLVGVSSNIFLIHLLFVHLLGIFLCYKSSGIFLLPMKDASLNIEGLVVTTAERAGEYYRIGHFSIRKTHEEYCKLLEALEEQEIILI